MYVSIGSSCNICIEESPELRKRAETVYVATKIPPKNRKWPARAEYSLDDVFPADYIREYAEKSLANLGMETVDLLQLHVWQDDWAQDGDWLGDR